jgi:hypothetical protein
MISGALNPGPILLVLQSLVRRLPSLAIALMISGDTSSGATSQGRSQMGCLGRSSDGCLSMIMLQDSTTTRRETLSPQSTFVLMSLWLAGMDKGGTGSSWGSLCMSQLIENQRVVARSRMRHVESGAMLRLKLVKTAEEEASYHQEDHQEHLPHGAKVLKSLVLPWSNSDQVV